MLIVFEGIDATGKTTLAKELSERWKIPYFKGGGWQRDTRIGERAKQEGIGARDRYFALMQLERLGELKKTTGDGKNIIVDRLVLVDVAHHLALGWDETTKDFSQESKIQALQSLKTFLPPKGEVVTSKRAIPRKEVLGIVFDVADKGFIIERMIEKFGFSATGEKDLVSWLKENGYFPEADTIEKFEVKRQAWLWCAEQLGWKVIDASGSKEKVLGKVVDFLREKRILPEGQIGTKESEVTRGKEKE